MKKIFLLITAIICLTAFNVNAETINYTPKSLVKVSGTSQGNEPVTLMLVDKSVTDLSKLIPNDVAYVAQTETGPGNVYDFNFKFTGNINDYNVVVRQSQEVINDTVTVAETKLEAIDADIKITTLTENEITKAQITAQIKNYFVDDMPYKMILAFYDNNEKLVDADVVGEGILSVGKENYTNSTTLPDNISKIKGFVWSDYQPLGLFDEISTSETANLPLTVYLVGDSQCCDYPETENTDRVGWGTILKNKFVEGITVDNCAGRGTSTESWLNGVRDKELADKNNVAWWWYTTKNWSEIMKEVKSGDYVMVCLGNNDKSYYARDEFTVGVSIDEYKENLNIMVDEAKEKNVNIVLITCVPTYLTSTTQSNYTRDYAEAMIEVANDRNVTVLDLNNALYKDFSVFGFEAAQKKYYTSDGVHINQAGAEYAADKILELLGETLSPLKNHVQE